MLAKIVERYTNARNIAEKKKLSPILDQITRLGYNSPQIYASIGEDAAAILPTPDADSLILISTDALLPQFIAKSPYGAGFAAVYVGIDDIMACGGVPAACTTTVGYRDPTVGQQIFAGILHGTHVFRVPLVRGHTTTDASSMQLTSTVVGTCPRDQFISSRGAQDGDCLALIWDLEGRPAKANRMYWDTITKKDSETFYAKRAFFKPIREQHLFHACKDVSMGGIFGTIFQLLSHSRKGAIVALDGLERLYPRFSMPYPIEDFLFAYLTSAFIITCKSIDWQSVYGLVSQAGMAAVQLGEINSSRRFTLTYQGSNQLLDKMP